jgi:uncharacterized membrane protein
MAESTEANDFDASKATTTTWNIVSLRSTAMVVLTCSLLHLAFFALERLWNSAEQPNNEQRTTTQPLPNLFRRHYIRSTGLRFGRFGLLVSCARVLVCGVVSFSVLAPHS